MNAKPFIQKTTDLITEELATHIKDIEVFQRDNEYHMQINLKGQLSFLWPAVNRLLDYNRFDYRYLGDPEDTRDFKFMRYIIKYNTALVELDEEDFELWRMLT